MKTISFDIEDYYLDQYCKNNGYTGFCDRAGNAAPESKSIDKQTKVEFIANRICATITVETMDKLNFKIQRFQPGHKYYTDRQMTNSKAQDGVVGAFQSTFGQCLEANGMLLSYTLERRDKLIDLGEYEYTLFYSELNRCEVPLLLNVPRQSFIEDHIANYASQLKGCTAHGTRINTDIPMLTGSREAFADLMKRIKDRFPNPKLSVVGPDGKLIIGDILGVFTYENLNQ